MAAITVKLPDGTPLELAEGATGADAAAAIGPGLAKAALAIKVGGELRDLSAPLPDGAEIAILTDRDPEALALMRHDTAHVMATAVVELWPGTKVSIGPAIENGFYYDFEFPDDFRPSVDDLPKIEEAMARHIAADEEFERTDVTPDEALERFTAEDQPYKVELIEDLVRDQGVETVSLYRNGPFTDLCLGPHGPTTKRIKAFKLTSVAGAYWRGDETRNMLSRIYGTAFFKQADLEEHERLLDEARERDHRRLGRELGLFMLRPESPGMPFWLPQGTVLLRLIQNEVDAQLEKRGYAEIKTPHIMDVELWHRSGHYDNYRENMYFSDVDDRQFALKPMNCPGACLVFGAERRSYRDLPLRLAEYGHVSRHEREGVLHGLLRVRAFTQDDAHVYCTLDQVRAEVDSICESIDELYSRFGFSEVRVELSTKPEKAIGSDEDWDAAEKALTEALEGQGREYVLNPGRRLVLRTQDRLPRDRCPRPLVAARHLPARLPDARALRAHLLGRGQLRAPAGDDPPRAPRLDGALRRDPDRALRRPFPRLARAGPGWRPARLRPPQRAGRGGRRRVGIEPGRARPHRRPHRVCRAEDPRRRAREAALHGDPGGPRGRIWPTLGPLALRRRPWVDERRCHPRPPELSNG